MIATPPQTLLDRFACIVGGLREAVAARGADKRPFPGGADWGPLLILLWNRLGRMARRFAALASRAGAAAPAALRPARGRPAASRPASPPRLRLPRGFGWLLRVTPAAACRGSQLRHLLSDPEFSALLAAAPALGRVLRPLCRMLAIEPPPCLAPRPAPPAPKPRSPRSRRRARRRRRGRRCPL